MMLHNDVHRVRFQGHSRRNCSAACSSMPTVSMTEPRSYDLLVINTALAMCIMLYVALMYYLSLCIRGRGGRRLMLSASGTCSWIGGWPWIPR